MTPRKWESLTLSTSKFEGISGHADLPLPSPGSGKNKSGRESFKNELTRRFGSKHRDPDNTKTLMGELMPLGKAFKFGIMAVCMFGPDLPTEKIRHADRLECWMNAAKYAFNKDTIEAVSGLPDQRVLTVYLQGLLSTALVCINTDLPNSARAYGQHTVLLGSEALKCSCTWALTRMNLSWTSKYSFLDISK